VCVCVCIPTCIRIRVYITRTHAHTHVHVWMCCHVCVCVCVRIQDAECKQNGQDLAEMYCEAVGGFLLGETVQVSPNSDIRFHE
jgi:hypothetical protein